MKKILPIITLVLILITLVQLWFASASTEQKKTMDQTSDMARANVGGDFTLTDQNGQPVKESSFRGRVMLVYFGFTHCPDICPVTIGTMSKAMGLLGANADKVAPIFITVDPVRDTPAVLKDYLSNFDKHFVGLTGTSEQIQQVAGSYKVYFAKHNIPWSEESPDAEDHEHHDDEHHHDEDYQVDHSGFVYLMGTDGKFLKVFSSSADPQEIAHAAANALK